MLDLYRSAEAVTARSLSYETLLIGAKESITPLALSSLLSTLVVPAHYATPGRRMRPAPVTILSASK
jgi:hypothetical protein